ncbi:MAG: cysteine desulfurase [Leptospiraceae bacterium]|nr:cysteine desulfurase [Leptospiraceae bacterium]MDW7976556.1 cysteine desulfurase [Leptospiraceae bacterium]
MLNYKEIKKDFPILQTNMNGKPLVYLDSAASSQKPQRVIDAFSDFYRCRNANIHRGAYRLSYEATDLFELTREKVKEFLNAKEPEEIIFTRNTTESINLVAYSYAMKFLKEGDEILVSEMEHHSNLVPWMMVAEKKGAKLKHIPLTDDYQLDYERIPEVLSERTKIISIAHMSNALGTIHDLKKISDYAKQVNAVFVVDGAQGASHLPVDVQEIGCDFYALSAHKMLGPTGVGVLYGRRELLEKMDPFLGGGSMIFSVWKDGFKPGPLPNKFEAGTPDVAGVVAFAVALEYLKQIGLENIHNHEVALLEYAIPKLKEIPGIKLYGTNDLSKRGGIISFLLEGVHPHDIGTILDEEGIAIRAGHHCCEPLMRKLQIPGTARASLYLYNGFEDIDALVEGIQKAVKIFKVEEKIRKAS